MRLRHITAGLLAVLLLCGTAFAGVCAVRCDLRASACGHGSDREAMSMSSGHCQGLNAGHKEGATASRAWKNCGHAPVSVAVADDNRSASSGLPLVTLVRVEAPFREQPRVNRHLVNEPLRSVAGSLQNLVSIRV